MMTEQLSASQGAARTTSRGALMLRRHKMLPHPIRQLDLQLKNCQLPSDISEVHRLEDANSKPIYYVQKETGAPQLPPTPPTNTRPSSENGLLISPHDNIGQTSASGPKSPPSLNTLRSGQSPPTPDFTPPRQSRSTFVSLTQNPYPSSISFITAPEDPYNSDEDNSGYATMTLLLSTRSSRSYLKLSDSEQLMDAYDQSLEEDSENSGIRPKIWYTESLPDAPEIIDKQDLDTTGNNRDTTSKDYNLKRASEGRQHSSCQSTPTHCYANEATETTTGAKFYLSTQPSDPIPSYCWKEATRPLTDNEQDIKTTVEVEGSKNTSIKSPQTSIHVRRSTTTLTHEPYATRISPQSRGSAQVKTLRHTRKQIGLRDSIGQPIQCSLAVINTNSDNSQPQLKTSELVHPSIASSGSVSPKLSSIYRKEIIKNGGIPVLVIPERTSCGKSHKTLSLRTTSSRQTRRSLAPNVLPASDCNTFHEENSQILNVWKNDLFLSSPKSECNETTKNFKSSIPIPDSVSTFHSSLCTSRASSLTTESLRTHNQLLAMNLVPTADSYSCPGSFTNSSKSLSESSEHVSANYHGYSNHNHMLSDYVTPYSQSSYETAGTTAEVSEALAVSLFPHQTRSIMVKQHRNFPGSMSHPATLNPECMTNIESIDSDKREMPTTSLVPPLDSEVDLFSVPESEIKDELVPRNPGELIEPPVILFHPPTPRTADRESPSTSESSLSEPELLEKQISLSSFPTSLSSKFEKFSPCTRTISNEAQSAYQQRFSQHTLNEEYISSGVSSISDIVPDQSKLHPFWRPTKFWDDQEDFSHDSDHNQLPSHRWKNSHCKTLSSRLKRSIRVLPLQKSREASSKSAQYKQNARISDSSHTITNQQINNNRSGIKLNAEDRYWGLDFKEGNRGRVHSFPGLGLRIENIGWNEFKKWAREKKKEKKIED